MNAEQEYNSGNFQLYDQEYLPQFLYQEAYRKCDPFSGHDQSGGSRHVLIINAKTGRAQDERAGESPPLNPRHHR